MDLLAAIKREERKLEKELSKLQNERSPSRSESALRFSHPGSHASQEASNVRCCMGEDFKGIKGAVGKV